MKLHPDSLTLSDPHVGPSQDLISLPAPGNPANMQSYREEGIP